jgi:hypothetical protein
MATRARTLLYERIDQARRRSGGPGALVLIACLTLPCLAHSAVAAHPAPIPMAKLQTWSAAMRKVEKPSSGCYTATYPQLRWTGIACGPPPPKNAVPAAPPPNYGLSDNIVQAPGRITSATGTIFDVANVTGEVVQGGLRPGASNVYSFQMNTNTVPIYSTAVCSAPANLPPGQPVCRGFVQFMFENSQIVNGSIASYVFIEYVLNNYLNNHSSCPSNWSPVKGSCYYGTTTAPVPVQNFTDGASFVLTGEVVGGQHTVTFLTSMGNLVYFAPSDGTLLDLSGWSQVQFNVFGDFNQANVNFFPGSTMQIQTTVNPQTADVTLPCPQNSLTAETANIAAAGNCQSLGGEWGIVWVQGVAPTIASLTPSSGGLEGGTLVNINGSGFSKESMLYFAGTYLGIGCDTGSHCTFSTPPGTAVGETGDLQIAPLTGSGKPGLFSAITAGDRFSYTAADPIPSGVMQPSNGSQDGGTMISVSGVNFSTSPGGTQINFAFQGSVTPALNVSCDSSTHCTMTSPSVSAPRANNSAANVSVTVNGVTGSLGRFAYPNPPPPVNVCVLCREGGGRCVKVNGKWVCEGTLQ